MLCSINKLLFRHTELCCSLFYSGDEVKTTEMAGHVVRIGASRDAYRILVGKPEGRRPLERPRRRWENNIKMNLIEVG